jgi:hypothetical protein
MDILSVTSTTTETENDPYAVVQRIDALLRMWFDLRLDEYMTQDHLFTVALLKSLAPDTQVRRDSVNFTLEYAKRLMDEPDLKDKPCMYIEMPLFTALAEKLKVRSESNQYSTSKASRVKVSTSSVSGGSHTKAVDRQLEQAAVAQEKPKAQDKYYGVVTRADNAWIKNGAYLYTATQQKCDKCPHTPKCASYQCYRCELWGHSKTECRQHIPNREGGGAGSS